MFVTLLLAALLSLHLALSPHAAPAPAPQAPPLAIPDLPAAARQSMVVERPLAELLDETNTPALTPAQKRFVIAQAITVLQTFNPHRELHEALLNTDPIPPLRALSRTLATTAPTNAAFHAAMSAIFATMRDRHTVYLLPPPLSQSFATLRFTVREYFAPGDPRRRYAVATLAAGFTPSKKSFRPGVEIVSWNGRPVDDLVRELGKASYGSNNDAQLANGVLLLSTRLLAAEPIPDVANVTVGYRAAAGPIEKFTTPWRFGQVKQESMMGSMNARYARTRVRGDRPRRAAARSRMLELRRGWERLWAGVGAVRVASGSRKKISVGKNFEELFSAEVITTSSGEIGRFVVPSFDSNATMALVAEISRVLNQMPATGLVVDLRRNSGGRPEYVKVLTELISDKEVPEQPVSVRANRLVQQLFNSEFKGATGEEAAILRGYRAAVDSSVEAGLTLTGPSASLYSLLPPGRQAQVYKGPVVTVVDGLTYSAGDLFAALHKDQNISHVIGTSGEKGNVGAGGASTVLQSELVRIFGGRFSKLPGGIDFSTAFARFFRTGPKAGAIVENFGVVPDEKYSPTLKDVTNASDCDLFEFLGKTLKDMA